MAASPPRKRVLTIQVLDENRDIIDDLGGSTSSVDGEGLFKAVQFVDSNGKIISSIGTSAPPGTGDAMKADNLDQFADVTQTAGKTLAITDNTTLAGGTHSGTNTGDQSLSGLVPTTRTVNGHALSSNVTVTASDVGAPSGFGTSMGTNTGDQDLSGLVPTTRTVNGHALSSNVIVTASDVGLGSVDNTADTAKPVSTAQQTALDLKANLASPTFTGTVTLPSGQALVAPVLGTPASGDLSNCTFPTLNQNTTGSAAKWTTARTLSLTGDVTYTSGSFDGTGNATGTATVANIPVAATFASDLTAVPKNLGGWVEYFVTGSPATRTAQTLADITGLTSGTLSNSTKYEIEVVLDASTSSGTAGVQYGISCGGTGAAGVVSVVAQLTSTNATSVANVRIAAPDTATTACMLTASQAGTHILKGFVTTRSTGTATISIQHLKVTSGTSTVAVGSVMRIRKANL